MITAMLHTILLALLILWLLVCLAFMCRILWITRRSKEEELLQGRQGTKTEPAPSTEEKSKTFALVGKTKGYTSPAISSIPDASSPEKAVDVRNNFAEQKAENKGEEEPEEVGTLPDDAEEMDIDYTTDEEDDEVLREELLLSSEPMPEVSPSSIMARDLLRLERWGKDDGSLDDEDASEVEATLLSLRGTILMDKYQEVLKATEEKHRKLVALFSKMEAEKANAEFGTDNTEGEITNALSEHPLSYYL